MATVIARLGDPGAPFRFRPGDRVAWRRWDGAPDLEFFGLVVDWDLRVRAGRRCVQGSVCRAARGRDILRRRSTRSRKTWTAGGGSVTTLRAVTLPSVMESKEAFRWDTATE